ncbi:MAG TPA: hypothetical protein VHV08_07315 [Pirellulales bacterium]|nr:hypothetical protein [Pirellulales bacterium]
MASPFAVFRRNQKILLAIVGIGAMVAFVFLDPVMKYIGSSRTPENPVVVETKYGGLKESDLLAMRQSRELVDIFLQRVAAETINTQVKNGVLDPRMFDRAVQQWHGTWHDYLMGRSTEAPEEAAVETYVLSRRAQQAGVIVNDRAVNEFLKQVSNDSLSRENLQEIVGSLQMGRKISTARLFEAIRTEMLASRFSELFFQSLRDIPPAQKFEYFCRLNRRVKAEIMPLAVATFVDQVPDPPAEELQAFFEKYKDRFATPESPEPGFKEPKRAAFQYFRADFAKFTAETKDQVTEAEIADYYEKNKEQFRALDLPADKKDEPSGEKPAEPAVTPGADSESPAKPDEAKSDESKPEPKPTEPATPGAPAPADKPPAQPPVDKPGNDKSSQAGRQGVIRLVSTALGDDEPAGPALEPAAASEPATPTSPPAPVAPNKDQPAAADAATPDEPAAPAAEKSETPPGDENEKPAEKPAEAAAAKSEPPKYEPLEKVHDQIRDTIAGQKASQKIGEIFDELTTQMKRYAEDLDVYEARKGADSRSAAPKPLAFAELAKKYNLEAKELPLVTAAEAAKEDIGQVRKIFQDRRSQFGFRAESFAQFAFAERLPILKPEAATDNDGNGYLFWKTEEKPAFVPSLDQVRDKVVRAWKMIKARDLARKRAQEYADQARALKKSLQDAFGERAGLSVTETDWFSWMTLGSVPFDTTGGQPRLSQIPGVEYPGETFMKDVFSLSPDEVSVTTNEPEDTVYVVRMAAFEKPNDELLKDFAGENQRRYLAVGRPDQRRIYTTWLDDVEKDAGIKWLRQSDLAARRATPVDQGRDDEASF